MHLTPPAVEQLLEHLAAADDQLETGGILIGSYSEDRTTAVVTEVTPAPQDSVVGRASFVRGVAGLREMLRARWREPARRYYLGEWHRHPAHHVSPSAEDLRQLRDIAVAPMYECREPLMMIAGRGVGGPPQLRVFVAPVGSRPLELAADVSARLGTLAGSTASTARSASKH